jgi:hypothetical protein
VADDAGIAAILADYVPRHEYESTLQALDEAVTESNAHRTESEKHGGRLKELETKLRGRAARDAYGKVADRLKVNAKFRDHVFELAKIPADADEPDELTVESHLSKWLAANPQYVEQAAEQPAKPARLDPGEGASRGQSFAPTEPVLRVTRSEMANAVWMRANQSKFHAAAKAGLLVLDE